MINYPTRSLWGHDCLVLWHPSTKYACSYPAVSASYNTQVSLCTHFHVTFTVTYFPQRQISAQTARPVDPHLPIHKVFRHPPYQWIQAPKIYTIRCRGQRSSVVGLVLEWRSIHWHSSGYNESTERPLHRQFIDDKSSLHALPLDKAHKIQIQYVYDVLLV